jgi:hypothetical protein
VCLEIWVSGIVRAQVLHDMKDELSERGVRRRRRAKK